MSFNNKQGLGVNPSSESASKDMFMACSKGDLGWVERLVSAGADVNQPQDMVNQSGQRVTGVTPLYMAAQSGQLEVCKYLIRQGADPKKSAIIRPQNVIYTPADVARLYGFWRTWWYLSRKNFVKTYSGSSIKNSLARSQYRELDVDIKHKADQTGRSALTL